MSSAGQLDLEDLRLAVFDAFRHTGRAPSAGELAAGLTVSIATVLDGLRTLSGQRHLVVDRDGRIVMAHPFSSVPLGFSVMGAHTLWWGGCCWDAFALGHLLVDEDGVVVATTCPGCGVAGAWVADRHRPPKDDWVAHFLVPVQHMWDDVVYTCAHQRLFCSNRCVDDWCAREGRTRGFVTDLGTVWRLASRWYEGRLERGYVRRNPTEAVEYLRSVGLIDPFWGTA